MSILAQLRNRFGTLLGNERPDTEVGSADLDYLGADDAYLSSEHFFGLADDTNDFDTEGE